MQNYTMKIGIITCMTCMFAVALTMGGPIRRQAAQPAKAVPIGGNVTLTCPLPPGDKWIWVYWKKNDHTIYSLEIESNTPWTNSTRYEGSNNATRLTIRDLKKTDSGIYHCKVATLVFIKERGHVLLSVTEVGPYSTSPGFSFRASTTIPPQPAEYNKAIVAFSIYGFLIGAITVFIVYKWGERIKNLLARSMSALIRPAPKSTSTPLDSVSSHHEIGDEAPRSTSTPLAPDSSRHGIGDEEGIRTELLSSDTHDRDDVEVDDRPEESSNASQALEGTHTSLLSSDTPDRDVVDVHDKPEESSNASKSLKI